MPPHGTRICPHCRTEYGPDTLVCPNDGARLDPPPPARDTYVGEILADRYKIVRILGEGGMGRVYLAEHIRMGRLSAVKIMSPSLAPTADAIARFNREAANASRINHPNVASIYDFGETADGTLYLAMEFIDGETLTSLMQRSTSLSLAEIGEITRQIADALNAAHALGIVHRDLKPDNVLVAQDAEGNRVVKVVDFGIAKTMKGGGQTVTSVGVSIGTPAYMSPEQLAGDVVDARSDIYSLALVTFALLTGQTAFPDLTSKDSLLNRLTTRPRSLNEVRPAVTWPPALQAALDRALSPEPSDRYEKSTEFARDVVAATAATSEQVLARTQAITPRVAPGVDSAKTVSTVTPVVKTRRRGPTAAAILVVFGIAAFMVWRQQQPSATDQVIIEPKAPLRDSSLTVKKAKVAATPAPARSVAALPRTKVQDTARRAAEPVAKAESIAVAAPAITAPVVADTSITVKPQRAGRHAWMRAGGDSTTDATPAASSIITEAREVGGHITRSRKFFAMNDAARGIPELRMAYEEFLVFASDHPAAPQTRQLRRQLMIMTDSAMTKCPTARDSTAPARTKPEVMCAALARAAALAGRPR